MNQFRWRGRVQLRMSTGKKEGSKFVDKSGKKLLIRPEKQFVQVAGRYRVLAAGMTDTRVKSPENLLISEAVGVTVAVFPP